MDGSPPVSSVYEILQAKVLECVAISSSRGSSRARDWTCISCTGWQFFITVSPGESQSSLRHTLNSNQIDGINSSSCSTILQVRRESLLRMIAALGYQLQERTVPLCEPLWTEAAPHHSTRFGVQNVGRISATCPAPKRDAGKPYKWEEGIFGRWPKPGPWTRRVNHRSASETERGWSKQTWKER